MQKLAIVGLLSVLGLASSQNVLAMEDQRYPGYNNGPEVLYQDWNLIKNYASSSSVPHTENPVVNDPKYPGTYFSPYVIYRDPNFDQVTSGHRR
jgi:hypothetical protein